MTHFKKDVLDIYELCLSLPGSYFSVDLFIHLVIAYQRRHLLVVSGS